MSFLLGFIAACVASIFFGSNFIVIKEYDMGDGIYWQLIMALGVWTAGIITCIFQSIFGTSTYYYHPLALTSGIIWSFGNILTVTIIKTIGMALGMSIWCAVQLLIGWSTGKFGILGTPKDTSVKTEWLNIIGVVLVLISISLFFMVKPDTDTNVDKKDHDTNIIDVFGDHDNVHAVNRSESLLKQDIKTEKEMVSFIDKLNRTQKNIVGITCSVIAGICYGIMFQPIQYLTNTKHDDDPTLYSDNMEDYVFTVYNGILLSALTYFMIYACYMRNKPQINKKATNPSIIGGMIWAIAMNAYFLALDKHNLGVETTFPIVSAGPMVVSSLWGVLYYKEVKGKKNKLLLWSAVACSTLAIGCIALSKYNL